MECRGRSISNARESYYRQRCLYLYLSYKGL